MQNFKRLTEQEKRERGDNTVSLYETFAVLRKYFATAVNISTFFGASFACEGSLSGGERKHEKNTSEASLKECSHTVWREAFERDVEGAIPYHG